MPGPAPRQFQGFEEQQYAGQIPLKMVGGNQFGRYGKISREETFNFIVSDDFLVPYAGYKAVIEANPEASEGRGIYASSTAGKMFAVIGNQFIIITKSGNNFYTRILNENLATSTGDVFMAENNGGQIALTDGTYLYVYNYQTDIFSSNDPNFVTNTISFDFKNPGYISFQNGRFIVSIIGTQQWVLSGFNDGTNWPATTSNTRIATIQSKPGPIQAAVPVPGGGNNLLILGTNVAESWQDLALAMFPYQRNSTFNVDYGCLNASSIAELDNFVVWLAVNEQSGPVIMYSQGNATKAVSTDGIDFKLARLTNPSNCTAFLFRQDGHLLYQFTFPDDNLSYAYDFNTGLFFTVTDENLNYHIARQVVFFGNDYYFVSLNGGNIYRFSTAYTSAIYSIQTDEDARPIPRIRVTPPLRLPDQRYMIGKSVGFTVENGEKNLIAEQTNQLGQTGNDITTEGSSDITTESSLFLTTETDTSATVTYTSRSEAVYLSISRNGGASFGNSWKKEMNLTGQRKSRFLWQRLGVVNDCTFQFRFSGYGRFVCTDGLVELYQ